MALGILITLRLEGISHAASIGDLPALFKNMERGLESVNGPSLGTCRPPEAIGTRRELAKVLCQRAAQISPDELRSEMLARGSQVLRAEYPSDAAVNAFFQHVQSFVVSQKKLMTSERAYSEKEWQSSASSPTPLQCSYEFENKESFAHSAEFGPLTFVGVTHFYLLQPSRIESTKVALKAEISSRRPDAILLEGFTWGEELPCDYVIDLALGEATKPPSETDLAIRYAFEHDVALVGADSQKTSSMMVKTVYGNDPSQVQKIEQDLAIVHVLHNYYQLLLSGASPALKIAVSIVNAQEQLSPPLSETEFRKRYLQLNHRPIPSNPQQIYTDFAPSSAVKSGHFRVRATNLLADEDDLMRNRTLLRSMQFSAHTYSHPIVLVGNEHLKTLGPTLTKVLGSPERRNRSCVRELKVGD